MASLLFYDKPVALNKVAHKNLKIKPSEGNYSFSKKTNSVVLAGVEFAEAAKEYPIVFAKVGEDSMVPVALLGLRNEENLMVDDEGKWDAKYIPAFVRRYPFVLAKVTKGDDLTVCVDESYEALQEKEGEELFTKNGENQPILDNAITFLGEYQQQYKRTEAAVKRLSELDLMMELNAKVSMNDGQEFVLAGLMVVDEKKLLALEGDKALELFKSGELAWVYSHLISLSNLSRLMERVPSEESADAA
jgi:hypothetical protein|tara:strand:+ start:373 stop:1113 length:741 start_codon:yes stop_codon:yes gene_type:complete